MFLEQEHIVHKQLIQEVERVPERLSNKNPCNDCKVDRQIGNPSRWQCECDRCDKTNAWKNECVKKLAEYETAEDEGRLVVLPCKVGDTVWMVHQILTSTVNNVISKMTVTELRGNRLNPIWFVIDGEYGRTSFHPSEIGKTVFLTREEAEKALKKMEGK